MRLLLPTLSAALVAAGACQDAEPRASPEAAAPSARFGTIVVSARTEVAAVTRSAPLALATSLTYANAGSLPVDLRVAGGCLVSLRVRQRDGGREWDQSRWRARLAQGAGFVVACTDTGARVRLPPGARVTLQVSDAPTLDDVLGDSLPEGEYDALATVFAPEGTDAPPAEVAAGRMRLQRR